MLLQTQSLKTDDHIAEDVVPKPVQIANTNRWNIKTALPRADHNGI